MAFAVNVGVQFPAGEQLQCPTKILVASIVVAWPSTTFKVLAA
jgi:hypothetical protein